ncbi:MAG: ArnT family glycosyltransferase [Prochlorotrichaceae cyanobacterium]|jgi:4-amino-4-deoxy-L-arabinose transferase-like glycosyltransferase
MNGRSSLGWYPYLFLFLWVLPLLLLSSNQQSFMAHDEGIYAYQARQIVEGGNWLRPGGDFNYDRAIGIQWIIALCFQVWGQQEWVARLPSALGAIVALGLTYRLGCKLLNPHLALKGALILSVTPLWVQYGRLATQDMVLLAIELLGILAFVEGESSGRSALWGALGAATFGLGFLIKGFMIIPVGIAFVPYLAIGQRRHDYLTTPAVYLGAIIGLIPAAVWIGLSVQRYGSLPIEGLFGKLFALSQDTFNGNGLLFYFWNIPANAFPWLFFSLLGTVILGQSLRQSSQSGTFVQNSGHRWILLGYPLVLLLELIFFKTRTRYYPLQLLPFFSLLGAIGLEGLLQACRSFPVSRWIKVLSYSWGSFALLLMGLGIVTRFPLQVILDPQIRVYGTIAFGAGLGWILVPLALLWRQRHSHSPRLKTIVLVWGLGWLLGSWLGLALFGLTGIWGDYNPALKAFLTQASVQNILTQHPITIVMNPTNANAANRKIALLLRFYVPQLGPAVATAAEIQPTSYAWLPPTVADPPRAYQTLGEVKGWRLIQVLANQHTVIVEIKD